MDLGIRSDDRVLVLGASGWFGREFRELTELADSPGTFLWVPGPSEASGSTESAISSFAPTIVVNFAFLTRERLLSEGEDAFVATNAKLTERFLTQASRDEVRLALTVSSGAAIHEVDHPYGQMKAHEESVALGIADSGRNVVVIRAYSVSGGFVRRPRDYAFSDFILQSARGEISVNASSLVFRRYCAVQDALSVAFKSAAVGRSGLFETGGDLVEMGELAQRVASIVNPQAKIIRPDLQEGLKNCYFSNNESWQDWCQQVGFKAMNLEQQVTHAASRLLAE